MTPSALRSWRASLGLTQAGAAKALGLSLRTFQSWEGGEYPQTFPTLLRLACAFVSRSAKKAD